MPVSAASRPFPVIPGTVISGQKSEYRLPGLNDQSCGFLEVDGRQGMAASGGTSVISLKIPE